MLPTFMRRDRGPPLTQALVPGGLHLLVAAGVRGPVLRRMQGPRMRAAMALGVAAVALWMAWETRV